MSREFNFLFNEGSMFKRLRFYLVALVTMTLVGSDFCETWPATKIEFALIAFIPIPTIFLMGLVKEYISPLILKGKIWWIGAIICFCGSLIILSHVERFLNSHISSTFVVNAITFSAILILSSTIGGAISAKVRENRFTN